MGRLEGKAGMGEQSGTWFDHVKFEMPIQHPSKHVKKALRYTSLMFRVRTTG